MKKLFSIVAALLLVISLSACAEDLQPKVTELETKITELESQITTLEGEKADLETDKSTLTTDKTALELDNETLTNNQETLLLEKAALETQLAELQSLIYDQVIVLSVKGEDGSVKSKTVGYNDDFDGNLFDLLDDSFDVVASLSEYGHFISGLEELQPTYGSFISFSKNGVMSAVGIDDATFEDNDVFTFELAWWDMTEKAVYDGINLFLDNQVDAYINANKIDYTVMAALSHLGIEDEYVTDIEVQAYVDGLTLVSATDYVKAIIILEAADLNSTALKTALNEMASPGAYGSTGYQLQAFNTSDSPVDFATFETAALADLATNTPAMAGIDTGAISILALSNYTEVDGVSGLITDWVTYIKDNQENTGAILPKDFGWGSTENAATMAQAVIGLVGVGVDPKGGDKSMTDMTKLNYNLMARLCEFQNTDGSFDWLMNAEDADLAFSTPQAFLALVMSFEYSNAYSTAVNAYDFN